MVISSKNIPEVKPSSISIFKGSTSTIRFRPDLEVQSITFIVLHFFNHTKVTRVKVAPKSNRTKSFLHPCLGLCRFYWHCTLLKNEAYLVTDFTWGEGVATHRNGILQTWVSHSCHFWHWCQRSLVSIKSNNNLHSFQRVRISSYELVTSPINKLKTHTRSCSCGQSSLIGVSENQRKLSFSRLTEVIGDRTMSVRCTTSWDLHLKTLRIHSAILLALRCYWYDTTMCHQLTAKLQSLSHGALVPQ